MERLYIITNEGYIVAEYVGEWMANQLADAAGGLGEDAGLSSDVEGIEAARVHLRRPDRVLCVHASVRFSQFTRNRLLPLVRDSRAIPRRRAALELSCPPAPASSDAAARVGPMMDTHEYLFPRIDEQIAEGLEKLLAESQR
jgi:hypothetical protein